jgi:hypothetical protein
LQRKLAGAPVEERPRKAMGAEFGEGSAPRAFIAEPAQHFSQSSVAAEGDPFKARVILNEDFEIIRSRMARTVDALARSERCLLIAILAYEQEAKSP